MALSKRAPESLHVCFVMPAFEVYSPVRGLALAIITDEVTAELRARGVRTTVISPSAGDDLYQGGTVAATGFEGAGVTVSALGRARGRLAGWDAPAYSSYLRGVRGEIARARPDVVVLFNDLVTGGLIKRAAPGARVLTWLENEVSTKRRTGLRLLRRTDGVLAVSSYIAQWASHAYGPSVPPITRVPNGVNADVFHPPMDWSGVRQPGRLRSLFVGRIDPNKGPLLAARAVRRAQMRGRDVSIDVAGPVKAWGHRPDEVRRYVAQLETIVGEASGRWLGSVSRQDLPAAYRDYDLVFVPSVSNEPFGLVALEAMASGCAVIASNRGGLPEVCGQAATLIDPESDEAFDEAIDELAMSSIELVRRQRGSRAHALTKTWSASVDALQKVIAGLTPKSGD